MATITFEVTQDRLMDIPVGLLMDAQEDSRNTRVQIEFLSYFVKNGTGEYLTQEAATAEVRKLSVRQLMDTIGMITTQIQETAVPKAPGG